MLGGWAMSMLVKDFFWVVVGAIAAIAVLLISIWSEFVAPRVRARRLKAPCDVWFNIQSMQVGSLRYVVQDDEGHQVRELALPPNFTSEIEIGYRPRLAFREEKLIVGCEGDEAGKPIVLGYLNKLVREGKSRWGPGQDGHMVDRHGFYHMPRNEARSARMHCIVGFTLQSRNPGTYRFKLAFVTAEVVGEARLTVHVVDKPPRPIMRCIIPEHRQRGCFLTAAVVIDEQASERPS